jgi:hypothetical protein
MVIYKMNKGSRRVFKGNKKRKTKGKRYTKKRYTKKRYTKKRSQKNNGRLFKRKNYTKEKRRIMRGGRELTIIVYLLDSNTEEAKRVAQRGNVDKLATKLPRFPESMKENNARFIGIITLDDEDQVNNLKQIILEQGKFSKYIANLSVPSRIDSWRDFDEHFILAEHTHFHKIGQRYVPLDGNESFRDQVWSIEAPTRYVPFRMWNRKLYVIPRDDIITQNAHGIIPVEWVVEGEEGLRRRSGLER